MSKDNYLFVTKDPPVNELPKCFGGKKYYATVLLDGFRQAAYFTLIDDLTRQYSQSLSSAQVIAPLADSDDRSVCSDHASDISDKVQVVIPKKKPQISDGETSEAVGGSFQGSDDAVKKGTPEVLKVTGESAQVCHDVTGTLETTEVVQEETLEAASESRGTSHPGDPLDTPQEGSATVEAEDVWETATVTAR